MALTATISAGAGATSPSAGAALNFLVTVSNAGATSLTLSTLQVACNALNNPGPTAANVSQPRYLVPNVPVGVGNPIIAAGASATYTFGVVFFPPNAAGPSPQNQPGGASPSNSATEVDPFYTLTATGLDSSGAVFSTTFFVPVLSTIAPFPVAEGGAFQFTQGANLMNLTMLGAL